MEPANHRYQVLGIPGKTSSNCLKVLIHTDKGPRVEWCDLPWPQASLSLEKMMGTQLVYGAS